MATRKSMMALAILLVAASGAAAAQTVQKCLSRDGHARYQSEPCGRTEHTAGTWDATPDLVVPRSEGPRPRERPTARRRGEHLSTHRSFAVAPAHDDCAAARAYRDAAEQRAGLARNYDLLSTLQERVFRACR